MAQNSDTRSARRPLSMWVLLVVYLLIALAGFARMLSSIQNWYWLAFAGVAPGPLYLAVTGAVMGLMSLTALVWLLLRRPGFRLVGSVAWLLFALAYWADRLLIMKSEDRFQNAAFAATVTILSLVYVIITLRPREEVRAFLDRFHRAR